MPIEQRSNIVLGTNTYIAKVKKDVCSRRFMHLFNVFTYEISIFHILRCVLKFLIKFAKGETVPAFTNNSFMYDFLSSFRDKINAPFRKKNK